jgi:hypothetical protein
MTRAEAALLAKARRGDEVTIEDKLSVIGTVAEVDWFRDALREFGLATPDAVAACARRKIELMQGVA